MPSKQLERDVTKIVLGGRFDTTGAVVIELPFNAAVAEKRVVIVDLSAVTFLSSYGVRVLLVGAKTVGKQGRPARHPVPRQQRLEGLEDGRNGCN